LTGRDDAIRRSVRNHTTMFFIHVDYDDVDLMHVLLNDNGYFLSGNALHTYSAGNANYRG